MSLENFNFKNKIKNKRQSKCRNCQKGYHNNYYRNNKEVYAAAKARSVERGYHSDRIFSAYVSSLKSSGCVLCSENFHAALDFHHIDPKQKDKTIARITSKRAVDEEVKKCVILCANCHRKFHGNHETTVAELNIYLENKKG